MITHIYIIIFSIFIIEIIRYFKVLSKFQNILSITKKITHVIISKKISDSWKEKVIKEREIKFVGKISKPSEFILSLREKKTSPKTLELQQSKTAQCQVELLWDSLNGPYVKSEQKT